MEIEVGDLVKWDNSVAQCYGRVRRIEEDTIYAWWAYQLEEARGRTLGDEVAASRYLCTAIEKAPATTSTAPSGHCTCPWSMLARGCECGAAKRHVPAYAR